MLDAALVVIKVAGACSGFAPLVLATDVIGRAVLALSSPAVTRISSVCPLLAVTVLLLIDVRLAALAPLAVAATAALALANAISPEDWPVAVACNVAPIKSWEKMYQPVSNSPFSSATTSHGANEAGSADNSNTIMFTVSPGWNPVPWK